MAALKLRAETELSNQIALDKIFANLNDLIAEKADKNSFSSLLKFSEKDFPFQWFSLNNGIYKEKLQQWAAREHYTIEIYNNHACGKTRYNAVLCHEHHCNIDGGVIFRF